MAAFAIQKHFSGRKLLAGCTFPSCVAERRFQSFSKMVNKQIVFLLWLGVWTVSWTTTALIIPFPKTARTNNGTITVLGGFIDFNRNMTADVEIISISSNTHTRALPLPIPMAGFGSALLNKTVYIVGGFYQNSTVAYNIDSPNGNWTVVAGFPYGIDGNAAVGVNNQIFSFGGEALDYGYMDYPWSYNPNTVQWQRSSKIAPEIGYNFAVAVSQSIYLITEAGNLYRSDDNTANWVKLSSMNTSRGGASCVVSTSNDAILVVSGFYSYGAFPPVEVYNITANAWTVVSQMLKPRGQAAAALLQGDENTVAVCGGYTDLPTRAIFDDCELYDWQADKWTVAPFSLNIARHGFGLFAQ